MKEILQWPIKAFCLLLAIRSRPWGPPEFLGARGQSHLWDSGWECGLREKNGDKIPYTSRSSLRASHLDGIAGPHSFQVLEGDMENFREGTTKFKSLETQGLGCKPAGLNLKVVLIDTRAKM